MDELVLRGMAKWPNVPAVFGWLELDRRGNWLIRGERIANPAVVQFIARNYERDEHGRWFFQNGPQRVFVRPHYTPLVYRAINAEGQPLRLETHTGKPVVQVTEAWIDENGACLLTTEHGGGAVHDADLHLVLAALRDNVGTSPDEQRLEDLMRQAQRGDAQSLQLEHSGQLISVRLLPSQRVHEQFGFCASPAPLVASESSS